MNSTVSRQVRVADSASPFVNTRPEVKYVGDGACVECHREISEAYRSHPMGRSLEPLTNKKNGLAINFGKGVSFEHKGVSYSVEEHDGKILHKAERRGVDGTPFAEIEAEVKYALGSRTRGVTYLIERDGFLLQSPIAWFTQEQRWDISPGYGEYAAKPNFERAIQPDCLFCHTNQYRTVQGTLNRYEPPIFRGHSIGCERCHGPGELHVERGDISTGSDLTIVNPGKLSPALRDSVCQQCHLQGSFRFARADRDLLDYRPGLPLHRFLAVFLMKKEDTRRFEAVGHVEQMESSRCFVASKGQLGCISCHDPHRLPTAATRVSYYRERCLQCHETKGCSEVVDVRRIKGQGDNCAACHMPRPAMTNIPHTAATDHRILRDPTRPQQDKPESVAGPPGDTPLRDFYWSLMTGDEQRDAARDMGVALGTAARNMQASALVAKAAATQGLPLLEAAVRERPDDLVAGESLAHALRILGRHEDAIHAFDAVLAIEPGREATLRSAGRLLNRLQRPRLAREMLERVIAIDPWQSEYHLALASACGQLGDWKAAVAACRDALRVNPELFEARSILVQCYLRSGDGKNADAEFQSMLRFYPASRDVWEHWYAQQKQASAGDAKPLAHGDP
jgi:Tfp pilus assembly protein PilF